MIKWKQVDLPALGTNRSTGPNQSLFREEWPSWTQAQPQFSAGWLYPMDGAAAPSTAALSTGNVQAYVDFERMASTSPDLRYYRYLYARTEDGRTFQSQPLKNLEYGHHRNERPTWFASTAPST
jgi:hypothetical protein